MRVFALPSLLPLWPSLSFLLSDVPPPRCSDCFLFVILHTAGPGRTEEGNRPPFPPSSLASSLPLLPHSQRMGDQSWVITRALMCPLPLCSQSGLQATGPSRCGGTGEVNCSYAPGPSKALADAHERTEVSVEDKRSILGPCTPTASSLTGGRMEKTAQGHRSVVIITDLDVAQLVLQSWAGLPGLRSSAAQESGALVWVLDPCPSLIYQLL